VQPTDNLLLEGDNLPILRRFADGAFTLIYADPPFNTGKRRTYRRIRVRRAEEGGRVGFADRRYAVEPLEERSFLDSHRNYLEFLRPRLVELHRLLAEDGTLYLHLDYREAHYVKVLLDRLFGRRCFLNEIIWAYDYGGRSKRRWPAKHDTILVYVKDPNRYYFNGEAVDREPYMAPGLVGPEKAARGKLPTDVWWHTIVPTSSRERTGYPTQKPEGILRRIVQASTRPGDWCLDPFAGSGTLGAVAGQLQRRFVLIDSNPAAIEVAARRLAELALPFRSGAQASAASLS